MFISLCLKKYSGHFRRVLWEWVTFVLQEKPHTYTGKVTQYTVKVKLYLLKK